MSLLVLLRFFFLFIVLFCPDVKRRKIDDSSNKVRGSLDRGNLASYPHEERPC